MRGVTQKRLRALALATCLAAVAPCMVKAAGFAIDPDPSSPTLGDMLDRDTRGKPRPPLLPNLAPQRPSPTSTVAPVAPPPAPPQRPVSGAGITAPAMRATPAPEPKPRDAASAQRVERAAPPPRARSQERFNLPSDWPVLEDEQPRVRPKPALPVSAASPTDLPVSATPRLPRGAAVVNEKRAVARPRNAPVLPATPPLPPLSDERAAADSVQAPPSMEPSLQGRATEALPPGTPFAGSSLPGAFSPGAPSPVVTALPAAALPNAQTAPREGPLTPSAAGDAAAPTLSALPVPPRRDARQIALHPAGTADSRKLLRDPAITNAIEPRDDGEQEADRVPDVLPPVRPTLLAEAARPPDRPRPPLMPRSSATNPPEPQTTQRPQTPPVALPPLEEPARVVPRARQPEAPAKPPAIAPAPAVAPAQAPNDPDRFVYVIDQDLRQFITDFARRVGLRSDVAATVRGRLTRVKLPLEPTALLRDLEKRFDIEWLIEGEILKVASRSDLATRILPLGPVAYDDLIREMRAIDIDVTRYPLKRLTESNSVILTAPSAYVGRVAALLDTLRAGRSIGPELRIVRSGVSRKVEWE